MLSPYPTVSRSNNDREHSDWSPVPMNATGRRLPYRNVPMPYRGSPEPPSQYYNQDLNTRTRTPPPPPPPLTSAEAMKRLSLTLSTTTAFLTVLRASYEKDIFFVKQYVEPSVLDYIWQDKLRFDGGAVCRVPATMADMQRFRATLMGQESATRDIMGECTGSQRSEDAAMTPQIAQDVAYDVPSLLAHLTSALNLAVDATVYETSASRGDNRTLAEKLTRMARDISGSKERVLKKKEEMGVLLTDLEMLGVLVKYHGGAEAVDRSDQAGVPMGLGSGAAVWGAKREHDLTKMKEIEKPARAAMPRRGSSYEKPSVIDEAEEEEADDDDDDEEVVEIVRSDIGTATGSFGAREPRSSSEVSVDSRRGQEKAIKVKMPQEWDTQDRTSRK